MSKSPMPRGVWVALLGQTFVSSMTYLAARRAMEELLPWNVLVLRLLLSALLFGLLLSLTEGPWLPPRPVWARVLFFGFLVGPLNQGALLYGLSKSTSAHASLLYALTPLGVYAVSLATRREVKAPHRFWGMGLAFLGVTVLLLGRGLWEAMAPMVGDLILLVAVAAWVTYTLEGRAFVAQHGPLRTTAWSMIAAALWLLPMLPFFLDVPALLQASAHAQASLGFLVVFSSVVSYLLWYYALSRIEASRVSLFTNLQPLVTALLAWAFLGESVGWETVLGGAWVLAGLWLFQQPRWPFSRPHLPRARGVRFRHLFTRLRRRMAQDAVSDRAAQVSFYVLLAFFPFLFFLTSLAAYLPLTGTVENWLARLRLVMPVEASEVVIRHVSDLLARPRPNLLTLGVVVTLWTASRGVDAFRKSLNHAYQVKERRPFWKTQALALALTLAGALLSLLAAAILVLGGQAGVFWAKLLFDAPGGFSALWAVLRWPLAAVAIMALTSIYYYALPSVKHRFRHVVPGALFASVTFLVATWGFTRYVALFGQFNLTYGSIGGVIVLLLWIYVSSWVFIFGGEWNASLDHLAKEQGNERAGTS